jgi:hypothetical protein
LDFILKEIFETSCFFFVEQRLARSRCYRCVFVFEHFFYSSATGILAGQKSAVNSSYAGFSKPVYNFSRLADTWWQKFLLPNFPSVFPDAKIDADPTKVAHIQAALRAMSEAVPPCS